MFDIGRPAEPLVVKNISRRIVCIQFRWAAVDDRLRLGQSYLTPYNFLSDSHDPGLGGVCEERCVRLNQVIEMETWSRPSVLLTRRATPLVAGAIRIARRFKPTLQILQRVIGPGDLVCIEQLFDHNVAIDFKMQPLCSR